MRAAVTVVRGENEIPRPHQLKDQSHRRHAGACHHASFAALQLGKRVRQILPGWIAGARVIVETLLAKTVESKRRGKMDRRHYSAVVQIGRNSGPHRTSRRLPGSAS